MRIKTLEAEERSRLVQWHHNNEFGGIAADEEENEAEGQRRQRYEAWMNLERSLEGSRSLPKSGSRATRIPTIPSATTPASSGQSAPNGRQGCRF